MTDSLIEKPKRFIAYQTSPLTWQVYRLMGEDGDNLTYRNHEPHRLWKSLDACCRRIDELEKEAA
jgi:hypothetical protein